MPDRVKQTIFDVLGVHFGCPGCLPALAVADVFAGGGSLGLEALSRGAASCTFFERNGDAVDVLKRNLDTLEVGREGFVVTRDAWTSAAGSPDGEPFGLVFLDPPYKQSADSSVEGKVWRFLRRVAQNARTYPLVVLHHEKAVAYDAEDGDEWLVMDRRVMGTNAITMFGQQPKQGQ